MNRQELADELIRLHKEEKISLDVLSNKEVIYNSDKYKHLSESWIKKNKVGNY